MRAAARADLADIIEKGGTSEPEPQPEPELEPEPEEKSSGGGFQVSQFGQS